MTDKVHAGASTSLPIRHKHLPFTTFTIGLLLLLIGTSGVALAADAKPDSETCAVGLAESDGLNQDLSTNDHAVLDYTRTIARMLRKEEFQQLDCLADLARSGKERFPGGAWKLHSLYDGLSQPVEHSVHPTDNDWSVLLEHLQHWRKERPRSMTASVALALADVGYAWSARGNGSADSVSKSGWKLFEERAAEAKDILVEAKAFPDKCPEWYYVMQQIAIIEGWDVDQARALFEEAIKFEPGYYYYTRTMALYLEPRWVGEDGDTETFVKEISDRIGGDDGDILYFQAALTLICGCEDEPKLEWPRIKRGFEASEKHYGTSMANLNLIAYMATHYGNDPIVVEKVMARIGDEWDEPTWKKKEEFDSAKQWAIKSAPLARKQNEITAAVKTNSETSDGRRYQALFEKKYKEIVRKCMTPGDAANLDKFETLTLVGANGIVEDMKVYWNGNAAMCVYQKLLTSRQKKISLFPPPPTVPYWVKLELGAADFTTASFK